MRNYDFFLESIQDVLYIYIYIFNKKTNSNIKSKENE